MTEPLRHNRYTSSDVPEFATYPAPTEQAQEFAIGAEYTSGNGAEGSASLEEPARKIGAALGRLVNKLSEFTGPTREKFDQLAEKAEDELAFAKQAVTSSYEDFTQKMRDVTQQKFCAAKAQADQLRRRAIHTANEYPERVILAAGIAGIVAGFGLRAWRENRD